jgi:hypothetical protein
MDSLKDVGDLVTQVNIAEVRSFLSANCMRELLTTELGRPQTIYRVNKDAQFTNLGPEREAPPIGKARAL